MLLVSCCWCDSCGWFVLVVLLLYDEVFGVVLCFIDLDCCFEVFVLIVLVTFVACGFAVCLVCWIVVYCCTGLFAGLLIICLACGFWLITGGVSVLLCVNLLFGLATGVGCLWFVVLR